MEDGAIDGIVGMHTSSVRQRVTDVVGTGVPFVYTPSYEGGTLPRGLMAIGDAHSASCCRHWTGSLRVTASGAGT